MWAEFFRRGAAPAVTHGEARPSRPRLSSRRIHRWVAIVFTLTVALNFAMMPLGPPPAWVTFAPLPPLLFLMLTGLVMLVRSWLPGQREPVR